MIYKEFEEKNIQSFEYETTINSNGKILGICELGKATIQLLNDNNEYSTFKESWIKTPHGSFYVYDVSPVQEKVNIKLDCYDIKYKLDTKYDSSKHSFPCTLKAWRNSIFDDCDVLYDNSDFPNSNLVLTKQPYVKDGASNRSVIAMIAEAGASTVITDSNDKFYFVWFNNTTHNVIDWLSLTTEKTKSSAINCVVLGRGEVEDNVSYPTEKPSNPVEFRIDNNYVLDPQDTTSQTDLRYETIIPVYNRINGFSYLIFNIRTQNVNNKLSIKLGDNVKFKDIFGNEITAPIMSKKITYLGGNFEEDNNFEITLSASEVKESSTDLSYSSSVENDIAKVSRKTDLNNMTIQDIISAIGSNGQITAASIILAINNDTSSAKINADELNLNANNIINLIANNTINLSTKNIIIASNNFNVDANGNLTCSNANITGKNGISFYDEATQTTVTEKVEIKEYESSYYEWDDVNNILNATSSYTIGPAFAIAGLNILYFSNSYFTNIDAKNASFQDLNTNLGKFLSLYFNSGIGNNLSVEKLNINDELDFNTGKGNEIYVESLSASEEITTPKINAGNIFVGQCTLSSSDSYTSFGRTLPKPPVVVFTPITTASGVIAPKLRAVDQWGFTATIGGSGFSNIVCNYIAVY